MRVKTERIFLGFFLFAVLNTPVFAASLYILVAETGSGAGEGRFSQDNPGQAVGFDSSFLWESCLMEVFFEAGHIVSNSPVLGLGRSINMPGRESPGMEFSGELRTDLAEARSGMADYFILALLSYPAAADRKTRPEQVSLRIYSLEPYRFVYEETGFLVPAAERGSAAPAQPVNEAEQARRLIRGLISHL
ncbi:MAG: hypothetical protein LBL56_07935 [Treponema sp.]|jgi:hypothetical protein|nr:hypothetical protein [Treponema sp.]